MTVISKTTDISAEGIKTFLEANREIIDGAGDVALTIQINNHGGDTLELREWHSYLAHEEGTTVITRPRVQADCVDTMLQPRLVDLLARAFRFAANNQFSDGHDGEQSLDHCVSEWQMIAWKI